MAQAPKELLYALRNLDDWHEPHSERQIVSIPGNVPLLDLHLQLPHDINAFAFSKYVNVYLRGRSLFATKDLIRAPFLPKQTSMDQKDSLDAFKLILMYTADSGLTEKRRRLVADMLIQKGLSSEPLRDEILIQLCNQTLYSGSGFCEPSSAWILLAGCLSCFQPSQSLAKYLLKYVSDTKHSLGYGVVCQQKLLQSQSIDVKCSRYYPPCLLEWTTIRMKSCMALTASFVDGVTIKGQVESWTTAEQFATNLLQSRRASSGILGWCVVLRDDRESYECAGHDYVLDLISEIEVAPGFPCGTAYFIASSDLSRPTSASSIGKYKHPDQPHNADRLRLMPLDMEELPDMAPLHSPPIRSPPPPVSPRTTSLIPSAPSSPRDRTPTPEPSIHPGDNYASRDEAVSQFSVLNRRPEKVPGILSKTSALNSRYHMGSTSVEIPGKKGQLPPPQGPHHGGPPGRAPPPVNGAPPSRAGPGLGPGGRQNGSGISPRNGEDMDAWLESVFHGVVNEGVGDLRNSNAVERRLKGGGDDLPTQLSMPLTNFGIGYNPYGLQQPITNSIFPQPIVTAPLISPPLLLQSSYLPQTTSSAPLLADNSYLYQQQQQQQQHQQHQRQQMMTQQTAEMQVRLQQQELEKKFMQSSLETEILRHQLHQVQEQTRPSVTEAQRPQSTYNPPPPQSSREVPPKHRQVQSNSTRFPARKTAPPARAQQYIEEEEEEYEEQEIDDSDFREPAPRPVRTRSVPDPVPKAKKKTPAAFPARGNVEDSPTLHPIIRNTVHTTPAEERAKGVTFSNQVVTIDSSLGSPDSDKSSTSSFPSVASATHSIPPPPPAKPGKDSSGSNGKNGIVDKTSAGVAATSAVSKAADNRPASGAIGSQRRPPVKMGQIIWPPKQKEEEPKPKYEPDRLSIYETKENRDKVEAKLTPEEIQRKVNEKIEAARRKASAEGEDDDGGMVKQGYVKKRTPLLSTDQTSPRDSVFEPDSYHTLDMKTRQAALEQKLVSVAWGTQKKSDAPKKAPIIPVVIPPPPPPPPPALVDYQVDIVAKVQEQQMTPFDLNSMDNIRTVLYAQCTEPVYTYHNVNWTIEIRKEFFRPMEKLVDPDLLYLVFCQIVFDVSSNDCVRLGKDDRRKMTALLDKFNVHPNNVNANHSQSAMVAIVDAAKSLPIYFSRIFAVNGGRRHRKVQMLSIGHSGVRLLTRFKDVCDDYIEVVDTIGFSELHSISVPKEGALVIGVTGKHFVLYSPRANQICKMIELFRLENNKISQAANRNSALDVSRSAGENFIRIGNNK